MIRKLILSAVIAPGAVTGLATTSATAEAAYPPVGHDRDRDDRDDRDRHRVQFEVLVRHRFHWDVYGTYRDRDDAQRVARMLERRGYDTRIEVERGR